MLGKTVGRRGRGRQRVRWLDGIPTQWMWVWVGSGRWDGQGGLARRGPWGHRVGQEGAGQRRQDGRTHASFRRLHCACLSAAARISTASASIALSFTVRASKLSCVLNTEQNSCHQREFLSLPSGLCGRKQQNTKKQKKWLIVGD